MIRRVRYLGLIFLSFFIYNCQISDNQNIVVSSKWDLWSKGTILRGVNIYQRRVYPELDGNDFMGFGPLGPPYIRQDFKKLSSYGVNYVNISHPGIYSENSPYQLDNTVLTNLKELINKISQEDMFVVISFRTGPGRSEFTFFWGEDGDWFDKSYYNDLVWRSKEAQDGWVNMWKKTAEIFKDNSNIVGYDLMVEPNSNEVWLDIWDPDYFYERYKNTLYDWNQLYKRIIQAIRQVDSKTPILVGAMAYSNIDWLPYLDVADDDRVVYMAHQYDPHIYTHQETGDNVDYPGNYDADYDGSSDQVNKKWLEKLLSTVKNFKDKHQVMVGINEYGLVRWAPNGDQFLDDLMDIFEEIGFNYAIWEWACSHKVYIDEVNAFNFRFGQNPNNSSDTDNKLMSALKKYWSKNTHRPSNVDF